MLEQPIQVVVVAVGDLLVAQAAPA